ncbi:hypothetical protein [Pleurocapsa sp. FMAR1]|uniref:hypothetical protein n=1 Tax=Pleurocapsa sp. FMAR1 TaxID=3040204 RepID=UPI0029C9A296|nr:hypothetical protein [Pleurocapsa sp. FMAR1]
MSQKTLTDFFGNNHVASDNLLTIDVSEVMAFATDSYQSYNVASMPPEGIVTALLAYWHKNNYIDNATGTRLSVDKNIPFVSNLDTIRRVLVTRGNETQVKHDFTFSVYTQDNSSFNPKNLVGNL